jgi:hypothetical protein
MANDNKSFTLFGYEITKKISGEPKNSNANVQELVPKVDVSDEASVFNGGGYYGHALNLDGSSVNDTNSLIEKYRGLSHLSDVDLAINDIVDQAIANDDRSNPVSLFMESLDVSDTIKEKINDEFQAILRLLDFSNNANDLFRSWYVDGRLYHHIMIDSKSPSKGIKEVRYIDPRNIRKVKEIADKVDKKTGVKTKQVVDEYFVYGDLNSKDATSGVKVAVDSISFVPSGLVDASGQHVIGHLHKALKAANQLKMLEDSLVIYRISRAPERRIFYIDIGNLPAKKGEEYVNNIMSRYQNKMVYDIDTGELKDDNRSMSMLEDFWLPRREGGKGTEISTLAGGENLGQIEDVIFFQRKLFKSLNVPIGRLESDNAFSIGRATEITREEVKFQKFINKLRRKFSKLFMDLLRVQLILKKVITENEWEEYKQNISIDFIEDNHFYELKEQEILRERLSLLGEIAEHVGVHFSQDWIRRNVLQMNDAQIEEQRKQIEKEKKSGEISEPDEDEGL